MIKRLFLSELVSDAEMDAITYCTPGSSGDSCENRMMPDGFITAASFARAEDNSWIQVLRRFSLGMSIVGFSSGIDLIGYWLSRLKQVSLCSW
jgi:hypothetical protein